MDQFIYFGSILMTADPLNNATYKYPSESIVIPSGANEGRTLLSPRKFIKTRLFAVEKKNR